MNIRRIAEALIPMTGGIVTVGLPLAYIDRLPDPVAIHWGPDGMPDGSAPLWAETVVLGLLVGVTALGPLVAAHRTPHLSAARVLVASANGVGALFLVLRLAMLRANLDVDVWQDAGRIGGGVIAASLGVAALAAALGWWLASDRPHHEAAAHALEPFTLTPGDAVVWSCTTFGPLGRWLATTFVVLAVPGWLLLPADAGAIVFGVFAIVGLAMTALTRVAVTVGPRGLVVRPGLLGVPRLRAPIDQITAVTLEDVEPMAYGGWGLRLVPGAVAVVIRRGEGLRVTRWGGRDLVVTMDGATEAGRILLAHLQLEQR